MAAEDWKRLSDGPPPEGVLLECTSKSGTVHDLIFESNLFWLPDRSMYVYFDVVRWKVAS